MSTARASLLGVKFGDSQMTSHAGGGEDRTLLDITMGGIWGGENKK